MKTPFKPASLGLLACCLVAFACGSPADSDGGTGGGSSGTGGGTAATGGGTMATGGGEGTGGGTGQDSGSGGGQNSDGGLDAGPDNDGGLDAGPAIDGGSICHRGEPYLSAADRAKSPRANAGAEVLAREASGALVAPDDLYARVEVELAAIKTAYPPLQNVVATATWDNQLIFQFDGGATTGQVLDGGYPSWKCLNALYGATTVDHIVTNYVLLWFEPRLDFPQIIPAYQSLPGVVLVEPNYLAGISSDICLSIEGERHAYIFYQGAGDCPSGCIERDFTGVLSAPDGGTTLLGQWNNHSPDAGAKPSWMTDRAAVCQPQGLNL